VSGTGTVQVTRRENATWIGVHRPDKRNALDLAASRALRQAFEEVQAAGPTVLALRLGQRDTTVFDLVAQGLLYESDDAATRMNAFIERRRAK
jgi:enoyl-CoA hydratase/carnithine racemase